MENPASPSDRAALIFDQARQLADAARETYLQQACKDAPELRTLIDDLLIAHERQGEFLAEPTHARPRVGAEEVAGAETAGQATTELPASALSAPESTQIGRYKLLQRIGEGGFGEVWMAEQREPIKRRVALKIIKPGMDSRQVIARFEAERQALAMMDHPNIARVLDAGVTDAGRPYFVMELVRGVPITEYADTENLGPQARLELFTQVCHAVQHAHQKGIIHRDLKPSNVLVTVTDGKPVPKVIDFGIAKATGGELTDKTLFTEFRQFIGTPQYMSPEQAGMSGVDIDTRSDVYSLGVLLYELLTGGTPFDAARLRSAALEEMRRIIREEDPPRPSTRVSTLGDALSAVARHRRVEPARLGAMIRGDLDWITMKCLEKDRSRRYGTASDLAGDVQRHLVGEAVMAAPPSAAYRVRKFVRKHKTGVLTAGTVAAAVVLGALGTTIGMIRAEAMKRDLARQNQTARDILANAAMLAFLAENPQPGGLHVGSFELQTSDAMRSLHVVLKGVRTKRPDNTARQQGAQDEYDVGVFGPDDREISGDAAIQALGSLMVEATEENVRARRSLEAANARLAEQRDQAELWAARGQIAAARIALDERDSATCRARLDAVPERLRNWEWHYLGTQLDDASLVLYGHKHEVGLAMFNPAGTRILTIGSGLHDDNVARMWDAASGKELFTIKSDRPAFTSASFASDGKTFLTLTTPRNYVNESFPSELQVWDSANGRELRRVALPEDRKDVPYYNRAKAAVSPDGTRVLWARSSDTRVALIDLQSPDHVNWLSITGHFRGYPFSPDGRLIYTVHDDTDNNDESQEVVHVWDASTGEHRFQTPPTTRGKQDEEIHFAMFSADSRYLITNQWSGNSLVWDVAAGTQ